MGEWYYHLGDALGSLRQMVDVAGKVRLVRVYAPFRAC